MEKKHQRNKTRTTKTIDATKLILIFFVFTRKQETYRNDNRSILTDTELKVK